MSEKLEELKLEADSLGIKYAATIGEVKLQAKLDEYYDSESASTAVKVAEPVVETKAEKAETPKQKAMRVIREQENDNKKLVVVKVQMVDKREASTATTVSFNTGGIAMDLPLDTFVEVPKLIVHRIEKATALVHKEVDGQTVHAHQKKYVVEYK